LRNRAKYSKTCKNRDYVLDFSDDLQEHQHFWEIDFFYFFFTLKYLEKESETKIIAQNKSSSQSEDNRKQRSGMKCIIKNDRV
jgi:hypothetical protein